MGHKGAGGCEEYSRRVARASESPPPTQPPAGATAALRAGGDGHGLQSETEERAPPMAAPCERSGEPRLPTPLSVRRLWPPRPPARGAVRATGAQCANAGRLGARRRHKPGALHAFQGSRRGSSKPSALPHRLHLPSSTERREATGRQPPPPPPPASASLSPSLFLASWETKGLFIKRIVGGSGDGSGKEGGSIKTR